MVSNLLPKRHAPAPAANSDAMVMIGYAGNADVKALFELLGMVAKADGSVTSNEIQEVERLMRYHISTDQREFAISCFRKGKAAQLVKGAVTARAFQLYGVDDDRWLEPVQVLDILLRVSLIDGQFSANEEYIVDSVRATLGVHKRSYWILRDTLAERWGVQIGREGVSFATKVAPGSEEPNAKQTARPKTKQYTRKEALALLELGEDATVDQIKISHRTLVKQFHPDLVEGKQASEEKIRETVLRFCEIQAAYETLIKL